MNFSSETQILLTVLIAGLVTVFAVLAVLVRIIKGYGFAVREMSKKLDGKIKGKEAETTPVVQNGIPEEVVAAISAAVYTLYGTKGHTIKSIRRVEKPIRSVWATAGLLDNTRPF